MTPESRRIRRRVIDDAEKKLHLGISTISISGVKFVLFLIPGGRPLLALFKSTGEVPTSEERSQLTYADSIGYDVLWSTSYDGAMCTIKNRVRYARMIRDQKTGCYIKNREGV